jgi:hypothetical protein
MEDALRVEQQKIGKEVVDANLNQETMGKEAVMCEDGKLRYPVHVSYDMGWQKSSKTYKYIPFYLFIRSNNKILNDRTKCMNKLLLVPYPSIECVWNMPVPWSGPFIAHQSSGGGWSE